MSWTTWCELDIYRECAHPLPSRVPCVECAFRRLAEKEDAQAVLSGRQGRYHSKLRELRAREKYSAIRSEVLIPIRQKEKEEEYRRGYRVIGLDPERGHTYPLISEEEKELNARLKTMQEEEIPHGN